MGTCVSKCCFNPPPIPEDKLVISKSPPPPPPSSWPLSSSSLSSSTTTSSSLSNISTSTSSSTCSSHSSKVKPHSDDFLFSCAKQNPHIIILDPRKFDYPRSKPRNPPLQTLKPPSTRPAPRHPSQWASLRHKRERSSSPTQRIVQQKSLRGENRVTASSRASNSPNNSVRRPKNESPKGQDCSTASIRANIEENINNPLIAMECFIFL